MFSVSIKKKTLKEVEKMPISVQESLTALLDDLREKGPAQRDGRITARSGKKCIIVIYQGSGWRVGIVKTNH
jgi:mRNA-degrading endonuclease RelE of RelBE toxin-antitoxin system